MLISEAAFIEIDQRELPILGGDAASGSSAIVGSRRSAAVKKGLKVFVIPKTRQPVLHGRGQRQVRRRVRRPEALGESGTETSGTAATAASQFPPSRPRSPRAPTRSSCRPPTRRALPDAELGHEEEDHGRHLRLGRAGLPVPVHQPGPPPRQIGTVEVRPPREAARQQGRDRDRLRGRLGDQPERLDRVHEAAAEELPEHESSSRSSTATTTRPRRPRSPRACSSSTRTSRASSPRPRSVSLPRPPCCDTPKHRGKVVLTGLGTAELSCVSTSRTALSRASISGTRPTSATWAPTPRSTLASGQDHRQRRARPSRPASSASSPVPRREQPCLLGPPFVFNKANIDKFN